MYPESRENPYRALAHRLFEDKQKRKKEGAQAYRFYKQKANSFIGSFAQRNKIRVHYQY